MVDAAPSGAATALGDTSGGCRLDGVEDAESGALGKAVCDGDGGAGLELLDGVGLGDGATYCSDADTSTELVCTPNKPDESHAHVRCVLVRLDTSQESADQESAPSSY